MKSAAARFVFLRMLICGAVAAVSAAGAAEPASRSTADAGGIGLLQMPTARFGSDGYFALGFSRVLPYDTGHFTVQALPWLEGVFRYTSITNRLYGPGYFSAGQSYKDRGFDFKLRLLEESSSFPALSLGIRDFAGTGLFGSEYLVASRRYQDFDVTLGLAWGRLGTRGDIDNPLSIFSDRFDRRRKTRASGRVTGAPQYSSWFHGPVGLFGGVEWATPWSGLSLKLEYDGNNYRSEPRSNPQTVSSPLNMGMNYRLGSLDIGIGHERGDTWMLRLGVVANLQKDRGPAKLFDPPPPAAAPAAPPEFAAALRDEAARQHVPVLATDLDADGRRAKVWYHNQAWRNPAQALGRMARAVAATAPPEVDRFTLTQVNAGVATAEATLQRREIERALSHRGSLDEIWTQARFAAPAPAAMPAHWDFADYPAFSFGMGPALRQHIGGPDGFYFYQIWWRVSGGVQLSRHLSLGSAVGFDIYNNFDEISLGSDSNLPRVRSNIVRYLQEGETNLVRLEANYIWSPATDWFARFSAGIFEEMYGGIGGEILYRPYADRWALGLNANRVRQRAFDQRFEFRDYEVDTGHLTLYYQLPWHTTLLRVSGGRYLAGDVGTTLDFSRLFDNGVRAGVFATFTDVSAREFGEGSFDKGFYFNIPLDLFFMRSSRRYAGLGFRPLTRDGGQKVRDGQELYPLVDGADPGALSRGWKGFLD